MEEQKDTSPNRPVEAFDQVVIFGNVTVADLPSITALVVTMSVALAISRQLGFFAAIDTNLLPLLSIEDIIKNSLSIVPWTLAGWAFSIFLGLTNTLSPNSRATNFLTEFKNPSFDMKLGLAFMVLAFIFFENWAGLISLQLAIFILATFAWLRNRDVKIHVDIIYGAYLLIAAFVAGDAAGYGALNSSKQDYQITFANNDVLRINLLLITSDNYIVAEKPNEILVVSKSDTRQLKREFSSNPKGKVLRSWVGNLWRWCLTFIYPEKGPPFERL
jgi:hypothetical protein